MERKAFETLDAEGQGALDREDAEGGDVAKTFERFGVAILCTGRLIGSDPPIRVLKPPWWTTPQGGPTSLVLLKIIVTGPEL